ncbi:hypothetical protein CSKR_106961 [Clonorchis sinensis]|uniref:Uncharacterized protein n=1 Tax=Clonorchis sinensis TaxID=79923 RepID=A0A419Q1L3_CLOSI|nr:hypothetical protein CSKR_106961 [Clonorchis sinensis]
MRVSFAEQGDIKNDHSVSNLPECFREIHSIAYQFGFCEKLTWNPAESPVCDVFRQLNVLHQAASCSSCYDIQVEQKVDGNLGTAPT